MSLYRRWRVADLLAAVLATAGLFCALVEYEVGFAYSFENRHQLSYFRISLRLALTCVSVASVLVILYRYWFKIKWSNLPIPKGLKHQVYNNDYTSVMRKHRKKHFVSLKLVFDVVVVGLHPLPFAVEPVIWVTEYVRGYSSPLLAPYLLSDFILVSMFLRCLLVAKTAFSHTEFSDPFAQLHCGRHGFSANTRFAFRCYLARYPGRTVIAALVSSTFVLSYVSRVVERPFARIQTGWDYDPFLNHVYLTVVTMTTVGFGDYVPMTTLGKLVTILTTLWGGFLISLLIVSVNGIFSLQRPEKVAFQKLVRLRSAVACIIAAMRFQVAKSRLRRGQLQKSSFSFLFDAEAVEDKIAEARRDMETKVKMFAELS